ncbi:GtrA family protein [Brucella intermedia]
MLENKILRFAVVGCGATITHLFVALVLIHAHPAISIFIANALAFLAAVFVSYLGHSFFTFQARGSFLKFASTAIIGLVCNNVVGYVLIWATEIKMVSIVGGTLVAPMIVYILSSFWVFTHKKKNL